MRWLAKWFGRWRDEHEDDEPARFPAPQNLKTASKKPASPPKVTASVRTPAQKKQGFDPYNSGAFERHNAWERTNLR